MGRLGVLMIHPAFGQHVFFLGFQQGELADFLHVTVQTLFGTGGRKIGIGAHGRLLPRGRELIWWVAPHSSRLHIHGQLNSFCAQNR